MMLVCASLLPVLLRPDASCLAGSNVVASPPNDINADTATRFRIRYPTLAHTPPISADMPPSVSRAYRLLDSVLRSPGIDDRIAGAGQAGGGNESGSDLTAHMVRSIYVATDYDPMSFAQYADATYQRGEPGYIASLRGLADLLANRVRLDDEERGNAYYSMLVADYILRVRVAAIDSIVDPSPEYTQYRAVAEVIDTLKGMRFVNAAIAPAPSPAGLSSIRFQYMPGNYIDPGETAIERDAASVPYRLTDPAFATAAGRFAMRPGQEAIVFLRHADYRREGFWDSYILQIEPRASYNALPIVEGRVRDLNHVWSDADTIPYAAWRDKFLHLRSHLLGG
jgi:hypothetical protein